MNEILTINIRIQYFLRGIFLTAVIVGIIYFTRNWFSWQDEIKVFKTTKINSRILELKDLNIDYYFIFFYKLILISFLLLIMYFVLIILCRYIKY